METVETEEEIQSEDNSEDKEQKIDWDRVSHLRVTRTVMDALKNLDITATYLTRANRRKDARKKYLGHGSRKMMAEAETVFGLKDKKGFCSLVQKNPDGLLKCQEDCLSVIDESIARNEVVAKECHAGLVEMAIPLRIQNKVVGAFRCGEFASGKPDSTTVTKIQEKVNALKLPADKLEDRAKEIPFFSSEKVAVVSNLMEVLGQEITSYLDENLKESESTGELGEHNYQGLITKNPTILDIIKQIKLIGSSDSSVIIYGESGTGKELVAKLIHNHSGRSKQPLVTINCAALTETILEAELFGYKKGAFTGATADKRGLFEIADKGTIFLDEVGEMSLALQVKILRLIQEGTFMRVGDTEMREVDVRVISATHRDLRKLIELGKFREDLYYRLAVVELTLPPLRERPEDVPILIHAFLKEFQDKTNKIGITLSSEVTKTFQEYYWPGNVRELRNEIERIVALRGSHSLIKSKDLSKKFFYETYPEDVKAGDEDEEGYIKRMVEEFEKSMLAKYLRKHKWNKTKVARLCGITRQGLNKKISKYQLDRRRI